MFGQIPNINGSFWGGQYFYCFNQAFGAFVLSDVSTKPYENVVRDGEEVLYAAATFDASRSSTIYNGSTLQPSALQVLPCIRI